MMDTSAVAEPIFIATYGIGVMKIATVILVQVCGKISLLLHDDNAWHRCWCC